MRSVAVGIQWSRSIESCVVYKSSCLVSQMSLRVDEDRNHSDKKKYCLRITLLTKYWHPTPTSHPQANKNMHGGRKKKKETENAWCFFNLLLLGVHSQPQSFLFWRWTLSSVSAIFCSQRVPLSSGLQLATCVATPHTGGGKAAECVLLSGLPGHSSQLVLAPAWPFGACEHGLTGMQPHQNNLLLSAQEVVIVQLCFGFHHCLADALLLNIAGTVDGLVSSGALLWLPCWCSASHHGWHCWRAGLF